MVIFAYTCEHCTKSLWSSGSTVEKKIKPKAQKNKSLRDKLNWIANLIASVVYISFILHNCPFVFSFTKLNND
jgi:hypothetical protein